MTAAKKKKTVRKKTERRFRKLSNVEHVRLRTGMWLGQNSYSVFDQHFFKYDNRRKSYSLEHKEIKEIPAKMKCLDEACMNCVDEFRNNAADASLPARRKMKQLSVSLSSDRRRITVSDDGRGIPAKNADFVFLHLMYGENFDDKLKKEHVAGQNGVGISLVRIVSSHFYVNTRCQGKEYQKQFTVTDDFFKLLDKSALPPDQKEKVKLYFDEHGHIDDCPVLTPSLMKKCKTLMKKNYMSKKISSVPVSQHGTTVEFELNPAFFNDLDIRFNTDLVEQYLFDIAITNPGLNVIFRHNKKETQFKYRKGLDEVFAASNLEYYKLKYHNTAAPSRIDLNAYIVMGDNKTLTWVNSNFASLGGSAIEYLENRICDEVRKHRSITALEKKLRTQATRNDVRSCFHIVVDLKILNPRFKSQDKSYLINDLNAEIRDAIDQNLNKMLRKIPLIDGIKDQMEKRTHLKALENAEKGIKKASRITIPKLIPPTGTRQSTDRTLFLAEGDSAIAGIRPVRTPESHGLYPLRGKLLNVKGLSLAKAMANEEIKNIVAILGLPLENNITSIAELNYDRVSIITDADFDGYAIRSLVLSFFYEYWPKLFSLGFVYISETPLYEVDTKVNGKKETCFCIDDNEFNQLVTNVKKNKGNIVRKKRNKGLGETSKAAMSFALKNCLARIDIRSAQKAADIQSLWFDKRKAEERRQVISEYSMQFHEE